MNLISCEYIHSVFLMFTLLNDASQAVYFIFFAHGLSGF